MWQGTAAHAPLVCGSCQSAVVAACACSMWSVIFAKLHSGTWCGLLVPLLQVSARCFWKFEENLLTSLLITATQLSDSGSRSDTIREEEETLSQLSDFGMASLARPLAIFPQQAIFASKLRPSRGNDRLIVAESVHRPPPSLCAHDRAGALPATGVPSHVASQEPRVCAVLPRYASPC